MQGEAKLDNPAGTGEKAELYRQLAQALAGLLAGEGDLIANAANTAALIFTRVPDINWAGFYFLRENGELVLGPFQGNPACTRIAVGQGVCGAAVARRQSVLVQDVHAFPGHIACDTASQSELVVPLFHQGAIIGVLDLDSPSLNRFDAEDQAGLNDVATIFVNAARWPGNGDDP
jgi:GAF domain-containing protein